MTRCLVWLAAPLLWSGCGTHSPGGAPGAPWQSPLERNHILVGRIWDVGGGGFLRAQEFLERVSHSRFLLLGEKHDNSDHHRIQAWILRGLRAGGRRPAVAFEMFSPDQLPAIERHLASRPRDASGLARAVEWEATGWPPFPLYQPVIEAVLEARLPLHTGNLTSEELSLLRRGGVTLLGRTFVKRFALDQPLSTPEREAMAAEIQKAHCGHASQDTIRAMIEVQRARDARMAESLLEMGTADGAVLIAGSGHVRKDRGVPVYLRMRDPSLGISSLSLQEVDPELSDPRGYVERLGADAFDYLWFTPRVDNQDPCEVFREQLEKLGETHGRHGSGPKGKAQRERRMRSFLA